MNDFGKRFTMLFVGLIPTIVTFWLTLWFWVDAKPNLEHDVYVAGWIITIFVLVGVPCIIFAVMTGSLAFTDKNYLERDYNKVMCMVRGTRAVLSRRIAPPNGEEEEEEPKE
jgi:hypothetical protein